jgi:hypothetical protein
MITKHTSMKYSECGCLDGTIYPCECRTVDQCCREIFNASYSFDEYYPLLMIAREAMLECD